MMIHPEVLPPDQQGVLHTVASIEDSIAMKLAAATQRGSRKDFVDIAAIGRTGITIESMLGLYRQKYAVKEIGHVLVALTYFDDADREPMPMTLAGDDWEGVKGTIRTWVKEYVG